MKPCILLCLFLMLIPIFGISASADLPSLPSLDGANAVYFAHVESGAVVCEKNATQQVAAGSSVKVMSGLLFCEQLGNRQNETVLITEEMVIDSYGYRLYIEAGDLIPVSQLLYAAVCGSYNDAFDVLACYIAGSKSAFVTQMNQKAAALGATQTIFTDPSGIDDSSRTTASDLGKIALAASQNPLYMEINSTVRYTFRATGMLPDKTVYNPNALLSSSTTAGYTNSRCHGMSAGQTTLGGACVVTLADNGKEQYVSVVLGGTVTESENHAYLLTNRIIGWVYASYTYMEVISPDTELCSIPVTVSDVISELEVRVKDSCYLYLPKNYEIGKDIVYSIRLINDELEAPVEDGAFVGYVAILQGGKTLTTLPLYTVGGAERSDFISSMKSIQEITTSRAFVAGAIFFVVVLTAWIVTETVIVYHRRHKWDKYFSMKMSPLPFDEEKKKKK